MHDVMENVEELGHEEHGNNPLVLPVSVTISILAVLVAISTLLGHRANTEQILLQGQANDQWGYYQAKNIRSHQVQIALAMLGISTSLDKEKAAVVKEKYQQEGARYEKDKEEIFKKAKELENDRDVQSHRADRFEGAEVLLEIALVICSLTLLTKKRFFWYSGILLAIFGTLVASSGFLIR
jgi:hypothetical protein